MKTLRYGFIGCGMMGQEHLRNIALLPASAVTRIFEPDEAMAARAIALAARFSGGKVSGKKARTRKKLAAAMAAAMAADLEKRLSPKAPVPHYMLMLFFRNRRIRKIFTLSNLRGQEFTH